MQRWVVLLSAALLAACTDTPEGKQPTAAKPHADVTVSQAAPVTPEAPAIAPAIAPAAPVAVIVPAGALYACVVDRDGKREQTTIEFDPKVGKLCGTHPEMGPCQYERNNCRASGGRVFGPNGVEITMQTEAEYDKKVMRTQLKSN